MTAFCLSLATHLSLYPILLIPAIILLLHQHQSATPAASATDPISEPPSTSTPTATIQEASAIAEVWRIAAGTATAFGLHQLSLLGMSRWITGNWDFLYSVYGVM